MAKVIRTKLVNTVPSWQKYDKYRYPVLVVGRSEVGGKVLGRE